MSQALNIQQQAQLLALQVFTSFRREIWEYRRTLLGIPLVISFIFLVFMVFQFIMLPDFEAQGLGNLINSGLQPEKQVNLQKISAIVGGVIVAIFLFIAAFVQLKYLLSCLYDDRRDKSIYFWRSLPVSDLQTVVVKLLMGVIVIPLSFVLGAALFTLASFSVFILGVVALGLGDDGTLWPFLTSIDLLSPLLSAGVGLIPFALWAFPLCAWLMLASMAAGKAAFLWATVPVAIVLILEVVLVSMVGGTEAFIGPALHDYFSFSPTTNPELAQLAVSYSMTLSPFTFSEALMTKVGFVPILFGLSFLGATYWLRLKRSHA